MRTGRGAAVGVVTEGVDVEAALGVGVVAGDVPGDGGGGVLVGLLEGDGAGDLGVSTEDADCEREFALAGCFSRGGRQIKPDRRGTERAARAQGLSRDSCDGEM